MGKVPYWYAAERIPHPSPSKAAQGLSKTRLVRDPGRAPVVEQIYTWRTQDKLAVNSIVGKLNADPTAYRPADPNAGWTLGGVAAMLRNPKYTGHQVFGRRHHGRPVPPDQWHWSPAPTHPAIVDRDTWDTAQQVGAEHATSRDDAIPHPAARRAYALRSRMWCKICERRMVGITRTHPERGPAGNYAYYICTHDRTNPRHVAAAPDHPCTVTARQDLVLTVLRAGLETYAFTPGRAGRLRELLPAGAAEQQARTDAQAAALEARLKQISTAQDSLIHDLATLPTDPADSAAQAMRTRIHAHFTELHHEHEEKEAQLKTLARQAPPGNDIDLVDDLPMLAARLHELPERIQAALFALGIQILWNAPMRQATIFATITDTTLGVITDLLTRTGDDPDPATTAGPGTAVTSNDPVSGLARLPMPRKSRPGSARRRPCGR